MKSPEELFWKHVSRKSDDGCWEWTGAKLRGGYGNLKLRGKTTQAHRISYELFVGPNPNKLDVLHSCDNPSCVNPRHLFLGDDLSNSKDKVNKDRQAKGESAKSKLREEDVLEIRRYAGLGLSRRTIAKMYRVGPTCVTYIVTRRTWKHL